MRVLLLLHASLILPFVFASEHTDWFSSTCSRFLSVARLQPLAQTANPYLAGYGRHETKRPEGYGFVPPNAPALAIDFSASDLAVPPSHTQQRIRSVLLPGESIRKSVTFLVRGSLSKVFLRHPKIPVGYLNPEMRKAWAFAHGTEIVKIRRSLGNPELDFEILRREILVYQYLTSLVESARYNGKPFIRVAQIHSGREEYFKGMLRQEFVKGHSAFYIQNALDCILHARDSCTIEEFGVALGILLRGSFGPDKEVTTGSLKTAQELLQALESFYSDIHPLLAAFSEQNRFLLPPYNVLENGSEVRVGVDFNYGKNVIWNAEEQCFVIVDW